MYLRWYCSSPGLGEMPILYDLSTSHVSPEVLKRGHNTARMKNLLGSPISVVGSLMATVMRWVSYFNEQLIANAPVPPQVGLSYQPNQQ
jgi:hypothetical protein